LKLGLFGGMFDPIHRGHLKCAEEAMDIFGLDKILFIPSASPPHKREPNASPQDRVAMLKLAIEGEKRFEVSAVELERKETTYTIDTLKELITKKVSETYFIIGVDAFAQIASWKKSDEIFASTNFIVFSRPCHLEGELFKKISQKMLKLGYDAGFHLEEDAGSESKARYFGSPYKIYFIKSFLDETSSTKIKRCIKEKSDTSGMLPGEVEKYITVNKVYEG